jgi:hypothetical protein
MFIFIYGKKNGAKYGNILTKRFSLSLAYKTVTRIALPWLSQSVANLTKAENRIYVRARAHTHTHTHNQGNSILNP